MFLEYLISDEYKAVLDQTSGKYDFYKNNQLIPKRVDKLYKFMPFNNNTIACLLQSYFWLSNPSTFNDPFDCNKNLIIGFDGNDVDNKFQLKNHFESLGITSFSEKLGNPLMWGHYTNNYHGIVLEIDSSNLHEYSSMINSDHHTNYDFRKVLYPKYFNPILKEFEFAEPLLYSSKIKNWEYEQEWRIIANIKNNMRYLHFDHRIIKKIFIGYNLWENNSTAFHIIAHIQQINYPHAEIYKVYPHQKEFGTLVFEKI